MAGEGQNVSVNDPIDDTINLQRMLNDAARGPINTVLLTKLYRVATQGAITGGSAGRYCLSIPSNVALVGLGHETGILCNEDGATLLLIQGASDAVHASRAAVRNLSVRGGDSTNSGFGRGVFMFRADDCEVVDCDVRGSNIAIDCDNLSTDVNNNLRLSIRNNRIHDTFGTAVGNGTGTFMANTTGGRITGNHFYNIAEHCCYVCVGTHDLVISGNDMRPVNTNGNCCVQIFTSEAVPDIDGIVVVHNTMQGGKYGVLASTTADQGDLNISRVEVADNKIAGQTTEGVYFQWVREGTIADNRVTGVTAGDGIRCDRSRNICVDNNTVSLNGTSGIMLLLSTGCSVTLNKSFNNDQTNAGNYGIRLSTTSTGNRIIGNTCTDYQAGKTQDFGIQADADCLGNYIVGNYLTGNAVGPVSAPAGGNIMRDNDGWDPVQGMSADRGDTSVTIQSGVDKEVQRFATALTANRTVTLSGTSTHEGVRFRVVRTGLGAFAMDVGGLKTIPAGTAAAVEVACDSTGTFRLIDYTPL